MSGAMLAVALGADHAGWELKEALKAWLMDAGYLIPVEQLQLLPRHHIRDIPGVKGHLRVPLQELPRGPHDRARHIGAPGVIAGVALAIALLALRGFQAIARGAGAQRTIVVATAAVREAANGDAFVARLRRETGLDILRAWLETSFAGGRHALRVDKISEMERGLMRARAGT